MYINSCTRGPRFGRTCGSSQDKHESLINVSEKILLWTFVEKGYYCVDSFINQETIRRYFCYDCPNVAFLRRGQLFTLPIKKVRTHSREFWILNIDRAQMDANFSLTWEVLSMAACFTRCKRCFFCNATTSRA